MDTNDWNDAEQRVERAQELFEQRKWQEALDELLLATTINPYNGGWFFNIGLTLDEMGRFEEAIAAYRKSLEIESNDIQALQHLGNDLQHVERYTDAIEIFEQIQTIDPTFEPCYCGRVLCYGELGEHDKAEEMFYLARLYKEHCPACYFNMGRSLAARELYDKAIFCWTRTLDVSAVTTGHGNNLSGQLIDATPSVIGSAPDLAEMRGEVHVRIAHALWNKGDLEQARQHYVLGLRQDPGNTGTLLDLSDLLIEMNRCEEAGEKIRRAIELAPEEPASHFCLGRWLLRQNRDDRSILSLKRTLELDPTWPGAHLLLGEAYHRRQEPVSACQHLRAELLLRPEDPRMLMDLANLLLDVGEARAAVACLKRLTQLCPDHIAGWQNLGIAHCLRGRTEEGIASGVRALKLDPKNRSVLYNLALANCTLKQFDRAMVFIRRGRHLMPIDPAMERLEFRVRVLRLRHWLSDRIARFLPISIRPTK